MKKAMMLLLITLLLASCVKPTTEPSQGYLPHDPQDTVTLEDIDNLYEDWEETIVSMVEYREKLILVESIRNYESLFRLFDLSTGSMDLIEPAGFSSQEFLGFASRDALYFEAGGPWPDNSIPFPRLVTYIRYDYNYPEDWHQCFIRDTTEKLLALDDEVVFGWKSGIAVTDVRITTAGVDISFGPIEGKEINYFAGSSGIARTAITFNDATGHLEVRFLGTEFRPEVVSYLASQRCNHFISDCRLVQDGPDSILLIKPTEAAKYYLGKTGDAFPGEYLSLMFYSRTDMPRLEPGEIIR